MKTVIFDLDGTLTDSGEGIFRSAAYAFRQLGMTVPSDAQLRKFVGPPLAMSFRTAGVAEELVPEAVRLYRDRYNNHGGKFENRVYDGIPELLRRLKERGFSLCVATSKPEGVAREIMERFELASFFTFIAGATPGPERTTKAAVIRYLLEQTGNSGDCIMVGDTDFDVTGARELGIPCIGVSWGYGSPESMQAAGAVAVADDPEELLKILIS